MIRVAQFSIRVRTNALNKQLCKNINETYSTVSRSLKPYHKNITLKLGSSCLHTHILHHCNVAKFMVYVQIWLISGVCMVFPPPLSPCFHHVIYTDPLTHRSANSQYHSFLPSQSQSQTQRPLNSISSSSLFHVLCLCSPLLSQNQLLRQGYRGVETYKNFQRKQFSPQSRILNTGLRTPWRSAVIVPPARRPPKPLL